LTCYNKRERVLPTFEWVDLLSVLRGIAEFRMDVEEKRECFMGAHCRPQTPARELRIEKAAVAGALLNRLRKAA